MEIEEKPLFVSKQSLLPNAYDAAVELNQRWESLPFYLSGEQIQNNPQLSDNDLFEHFIRIPKQYIPNELVTLEPPKINHQRIVQTKPSHKIDKTEANKLMAEENWNDHYSDEDLDDYNAAKFEDYDQEDDISGNGSED
ncbi:Uncharacterized protein QTN25_008583 [Entamoeba marina]